MQVSQIGIINHHCHLLNPSFLYNVHYYCSCRFHLWKLKFHSRDCQKFMISLVKNCAIRCSEQIIHLEKSLTTDRSASNPVTKNKDRTGQDLLEPNACAWHLWCNHRHCNRTYSPLEFTYFNNGMFMLEWSNIHPQIVATNSKSFRQTFSDSLLTRLELSMHFAYQSNLTFCTPKKFSMPYCLVSNEELKIFLPS